MLVNILQTFDDANGKRRFAGENPDVDPAIARQWIADGRAAADTDNTQDSGVSILGKASPSVRYVAVLGDSNTANAFSDAYTNTCNGYAAFVGPLSRGRLQVIYSGATGGQEIVPDVGQTNSLSVQIDNLLSNSLYQYVDDVVVMLGTNDMDTAPDTVLAAYQAQLARLSAKRVWVSTIYPVGATLVDVATVDANTPRWVWIHAFNRGLFDLVQRLGVKYRIIDTFTALASATSAKGQAATGAMGTDDLHSSTYGACLAGQAVVNALCTGMPATYPYVTSAADYAANTGATSSPYKPNNIHPDPLFAASSSWTASGSGVTGAALSLVSNDITGIGQLCRITADATAAVAQSYLRATGVSCAARAFAGDTVYAELLVRVPAGHVAGTIRLGLSVNITGTGAGNYNLYDHAMPNQTSYPGSLKTLSTGELVMLLRTPKFAIPSGATVTNVTPVLTCFLSGAGSATETVDFGHAVVRRVTNGLF